MWDRADGRNRPRPAACPYKGDACPKEADGGPGQTRTATSFRRRFYRPRPPIRIRTGPRAPKTQRSENRQSGTRDRWRKHIKAASLWIEERVKICIASSPGSPRGRRISFPTALAACGDGTHARRSIGPSSGHATIRTQAPYSRERLLNSATTLQSASTWHWPRPNRGSRRKCRPASTRSIAASAASSPLSCVLSGVDSGTLRPA